MSKFEFWTNFCTKLLRHKWKIKFISAYSSFFLRIRRIHGKCLSVYGEYGEWVVCGTQSRLRIHGKNLCVHGENANRYKTGDILVINGPTWKIFYIITFYTKWVRLSQKTISRYCPFKAISQLSHSHIFSVIFLKNQYWLKINMLQWYLTCDM